MCPDGRLMAFARPPFAYPSPKNVSNLTAVNSETGSVCYPVVTSRSQRRLASWAYATCSSAWTPACFTLRIFVGCRAVAGSEPLVILSQTQTRHARNICPRLARLLMILTRPPAPNTLLVTLCRLQIRQHRRDRLDIRRPRRDDQMTIRHFGFQASLLLANP
jgi:hypothetical protein